MESLQVSPRPAPPAANGRSALPAVHSLGMKAARRAAMTGAGHPSDLSAAQVARLEFFVAAEGQAILAICASDRVVNPARLLTALGTTAVRRATQEEVWTLAHGTVLPTVLVDAPLLDEPVLWMRAEPDAFVAVEPDTLRGRWKARVDLLSF